ncbi:ATP-dependent endonuclease [Anaeromyxobacter sp. SG17]|uniref:ATP-dependent nuclease n=1 Tax=unclassified Anaeromyxobacter TaxID=2620896 RepID=UPI0035A907D5
MANGRRSCGRHLPVRPASVPPVDSWSVRLYRVEIERFRGIRHLRWSPGGGVACLVGPGDSGKTTILDAIDLLLAPRWNAAFDDSDFLGADTSQPISITGVLGPTPE